MDRAMKAGGGVNRPVFGKAAQPAPQPVQQQQTVLSPRAKTTTVDPEVLKQAELMEKRREEERLRIEAMDSKFGFKKTVGFQATHDEPTSTGVVSGSGAVNKEEEADKEMGRLNRVLSAKGYKPPPKKSAEELEKERLAWKQAQESKMLNPNNIIASLQTSSGDTEAQQRAAREQAERERAAREQAEKERVAREQQAAKEQAEREQAAREQAAREQAAREQAAREQAAREQAEREAAAQQAQQRKSSSSSS